jgi:hypothetical protein
VVPGVVARDRKGRYLACGENTPRSYKAPYGASEWRSGSVLAAI